MAGLSIGMEELKKVILSQANVFTPDDIAKTTTFSRSAAYTLITKELIPSGLVMIDGKDGHRINYAVTGRGSDTSKGIITTSQPKIKDIMSLTPVERFGYISQLADMVIGGISPSLLVTGISGIGKSHIINERLKANDKVENEDFHIIKGKATPLGLYRFLHDHRDSTVVFDDCDSVFESDTSVNLLKSALDSYETRKISWISERLPEDLDATFEFNGQVIFISNQDARNIDSAVLSRTMCIDLQMSRKEITEHLKNIIDVIEPKVEKSIKLEVLEFLDTMRDELENYNIRTFIKACRVRQFADRQKSDWKKTFMVLS